MNPIRLVIVLSWLGALVGCPLNNAVFGSPCSGDDECTDSYVCVEDACVPRGFVVDAGRLQRDAGALDAGDAGTGEPADAGSSTDGGDEDAGLDAGVLNPQDAGGLDAGPPLGQVIVLQPDGLASEADFGEMVAAFGNRFAVGAPGSFGGVNQVWVYERDEVGVTNLDVLQTVSAQAGSQFGEAMAMVGDVLLVGSPNFDGSGGDFEGLVEAFEWTGDSFVTAGTMSAPDPAPDARFGRRVAARQISDGGVEVFVSEPERDVGDGGTVVRAGKVHVFHRSGSASWMHVAELVSPDPRDAGTLGTELALSADGLSLAVGALGETEDDGVARTGRVHVFTRPATSDNFAWSTVLAGPPAMSLNFGEYGRSLAFFEGDLFVGMPEFNPDSQPGEQTGAILRYSDAMTMDGSPIVPLTEHNEYFGRSMAFSSDALYVGSAPDLSFFTTSAGGLHRFINPADWQDDSATLPPVTVGGPDARLGYSIAVGSDFVVVGAPRATRDTQDADGGTVEEVGAVVVLPL